MTLNWTLSPNKNNNNTATNEIWFAFFWFSWPMCHFLLLLLALTHSPLTPILAFGINTTETHHQLLIFFRWQRQIGVAKKQNKKQFATPNQRSKTYRPTKHETLMKTLKVGSIFIELIWDYCQLSVFLGFMVSKEWRS